MQKMEGESEMSLKKQRSYLISTAKEIAEGLCKVIQNGRMFSAFLNARCRFKSGARVSDELMQMYEDYCENPNEKRRTLFLVVVCCSQKPSKKAFKNRPWNVFSMSGSIFMIV